MSILLIILPRLTAWLTLLLLATLLGGCASTHAHPDHGSAPTIAAATGDAEPVQLHPGTASARVNGLSCPLCAESLIATINRIEGVGNASLDLGSGTLTMDIGKQPPSADRIAKAIDDAGFTFVGFVDP